MFGPGGAPPVLLLLEGDFFGFEPLSDGESPLVILFVDVNIIEGILQQSNFLPFILEERYLWLPYLIIN